MLRCNEALKINDFIINSNELSLAKNHAFD